MATKTETNLDSFKINYLSESLYQEAVRNGQINENELYMTPYEDVSVSVSWNDISGKPSSFPPSSHTHDDRYYTVTEMDGKLNGKASTSELNTHTNNTTSHLTYTERLNWNNASSHANSAHAPVNAEPNQNAFSSIYVNGYTISADNETDTLNLVAGNGINIVPDTTYDRITISADSTSCTLEDLGVTASAMELNYCDGVSSNIQSQLNYKASVYHTHSAADISDLPDVTPITNEQIDSLRYL